MRSSSRMAGPVGAANASRRTAACAVLACVALLAGCAHKPAKPVTAVSLFEAAHKSMLIGDFRFAVKEYEALTARFPFSSQSRQARLDLIYCNYREGEKDTAIDAADQFLRENPTHPRVDYAWYMKGLVYFERQPWKIERWLGVDMARKPPSDALKSINAFDVTPKFTVKRTSPASDQRLFWSPMTCQHCSVSRPKRCPERRNPCGRRNLLRLLRNRLNAESAADSTQVFNHIEIPPALTATGRFDGFHLLPDT